MTGEELSTQTRGVFEKTDMNTDPKRGTFENNNYGNRMDERYKVPERHKDKLKSLEDYKREIEEEKKKCSQK